MQPQIASLGSTSNAPSFCRITASTKSVSRSSIHSRTDRRQVSTITASTAVDEPSTTDALSNLSQEEIAASRKYMSLLPPFFNRTTKFQQYGPNLYGLVQPLKIPGQADIQIRMITARLEDGSLLVCSPVAPTEEAMLLLKSLGTTVSHIVIPNTSPEHWLYGPALAEKYPEATLWTVPGFYTGAGVPFPGRSLFFNASRKINPQATLGETPLPDNLQGQLESVLFQVPFFSEAAVILPKHKALLLADTAVKLDASDEEYSSMKGAAVKTAEVMGVWDRLGPITRVVFEQNRVAGQRWVEEVLAHDFDMIVPAHSSAPVVPGKQSFEDCFDFLFV